MIRYLLYQKKGIKVGDGLNYPLPKKDDFLVLFMINSKEEESQKVADTMQLNIRILRNYFKEPTSKTFSTDPLQIVFGDYYLDDNEEIKYIHVLITVTKNTLIFTIPSKTQRYIKFLDKLPTTLKTNPEENNIGFVLYDFLDDHTQDNHDILRVTEEKIIRLEQQVLNFESKHLVNVNEIIRLKRELFRMSRRFWSSAKIIFMLRKKITNVTISDRTMRLLDDVYETYIHQLDILTSQREMITDIINIYSTNLSNRLAKISNDLNIIMKKLTSFTVIIMVPTLIASMYGMNFKYLPVASNGYGFFEITALMAILALLFYYYFHKKDWI